MNVVGMTPTIRGTGEIELRVHLYDRETDETRSESFVMDYENGWHLASNLMSVLRGLADQRMRNAAAGDCRTCNNLRIIEVKQRGGQMMREHCPDCREAYTHATPAFPEPRD